MKRITPFWLVVGGVGGIWLISSGIVGGVLALLKTPFSLPGTPPPTAPAPGSPTAGEPGPVGDIE